MLLIHAGAGTRCFRMGGPRTKRSIAGSNSGNQRKMLLRTRPATKRCHKSRPSARSIHPHGAGNDARRRGRAVRGRERHVCQTSETRSSGSFSRLYSHVETGSRIVNYGYFDFRCHPVCVKLKLQTPNSKLQTPKLPDGGPGRARAAAAGAAMPPAYSLDLGIKAVVKIARGATYTPGRTFVKQILASPRGCDRS